MSLLTLNNDQDVAQSDVIIKTNFEITTLTAAQARNIIAAIPEASSSSFMQNSEGTTTTTPLSSAFRHISNYYFSSTAADSIPVAQDNNTLSSICRSIQLGRKTSDDGIASGSITAVMSFGLVTGLTFIDIPETSVTGNAGRKGTLVEQGNTGNIVGTVWYDSASMIFHGGESDTNFLTSSVSGFDFGTGATAGKIAINTLSFQSLSIVKRSIFFCRAFNKEFNYTNNPTAISNNSLGTITSSLTANPTTFITSVGLYNDDGELVAIAKVSPPVKKTFDIERSFAVRLQY